MCFCLPAIFVTGIPISLVLSGGLVSFTYYLFICITNRGCLTFRTMLHKKYVNSMSFHFTYLVYFCPVLLEKDTIFLHKIFELLPKLGGSSNKSQASYYSILTCTCILSFVSIQGFVPLGKHKL